LTPAAAFGFKVNRAGSNAAEGPRRHAGSFGKGFGCPAGLLAAADASGRRQGDFDWTESSRLREAKKAEKAAAGLSAARGGENVKALLALSRAIDAVNLWLGKTLSWLILITVLVSATNATIRKVFDTSSNAWLELQWLLFSVVFLFCASWTLLANEHIRIDIVNNLFPKRVRNIIDVIGHAFFLLPFTIVMIIVSYPFFLRSAPSGADFMHALEKFRFVFADSPLHWPGNLFHWWQGILGIGEQSNNAGGLPQWPAKSLVFLGFIFLFFQGISELIKRIAVMRGEIPDPNESGGGLLAAAEAEAERVLAAAKSDTAAH
jgi:TRAP-type mannitol/chloroaromatic compound transport system permease small subunit